MAQIEGEKICLRVLTEHDILRILAVETLGKLIYSMTEAKAMAEKCRAQNYKNCDKLAE